MRSGPSSGPSDTGEEPSQDPSGRAVLDAAGSRRSGKRVTPDDQRDREGEVRPEPADRVPNRQGVRVDDRRGLRRRGLKVGERRVRSR